MTNYTILAFLFFIVPTLSCAFGITAMILDRKHKIGDLSYVEFTKHHAQTITQFECSQKELKRAVTELKKNSGR